MTEPRVGQPDLEKFRDYLHVAAQIDLDPQLRGKVDLSGVIQQTLLDAHIAFENFRGSQESELFAWLRSILANNLIDEIRKLDRAKYDARLEVSLAKTSQRLESVLIGDHTPPDEKAIRNEELQRLTKGLLALTAEQRTAIILHHLHGFRLTDVAASLEKSKEAIAGLIYRGMMRLRDLLGDSSSLNRDT